ncbi:MAG: DMT family transporter [Anaerolineaceae bacterium]|jgi:drug/metabolite transporter (DMT)-like permease|nr:MAG: EamA family transporter [Chloroflexi bacterium HGW-Chloroflexi-8]
MSISKKPLSRLQSDLILLFTAAVWGSGFIAQRIAAPSTNVFLFNGCRFLIGALLLFPLIKFRLEIPKKQLRNVIIAGLLLFSAGALQQAGMQTTSAGNAGFITGLYVVIVPIFLYVFWKQKQHWVIWISASLAIVGMLLLSTGGVIKFVPGDLLEFLGAILWAMHVIVVGISVRQLNPLHFAVGQFLASAFFNLIFGLMFDPQSLLMIPDLWLAIVYNGVFSVAIGFTLQGVGQENAPSTDAALILSMEAVFAALFGFIFLHERFTPIQLLGCFFVMIAILFSQLPFDKMIRFMSKKSGTQL